VFVVDADGTRLGQLEGRIARRLIDLTRQGNVYRAYVVQLTGDTLRIILREVFRAPHLLDTPSFPPQPKIAPPRPYLPETFGREEEVLEEEEELLEEAEALEEEVEEEAVGEVEEPVGDELLSTVDEEALISDFDLDDSLET